jgi:hypothetical protein
MFHCDFSERKGVDDSTQVLGAITLLISSFVISLTSLIQLSIVKMSFHRPST